MKLLLDEHLAPAIAVALRDGGTDVSAVAERIDLRGLSEPELLSAASREGRVMVTENARDFIVLGGSPMVSGRPHPGIVLLSPRTFPRSRGAIGLVVRALRELLDSHPADDPLTSQVVWLRLAVEDQG